MTKRGFMKLLGVIAGLYAAGAVGSAFAWAAFDMAWWASAESSPERGAVLTFFHFPGGLFAAGLAAFTFGYRD